MNWKQIAKASFGASLLTAGFGCTAYDDWNSAAKTHRCTEAQMSKAQAEADWCTKNTDYLSTYCYATAIIRNCVRMTPNAKGQRAAEGRSAAPTGCASNGNYNERTDK